MVNHQSSTKLLKFPFFFSVKKNHSDDSMGGAGGDGWSWWRSSRSTENGESWPWRFTAILKRRLAALGAFAVWFFAVWFFSGTWWTHLRKLYQILGILRMAKVCGKVSAKNLPIRRPPPITLNESQTCQDRQTNGPWNHLLETMWGPNPYKVMHKNDLGPWGSSARDVTTLSWLFVREDPMYFSAVSQHSTVPKS